MLACVTTYLLFSGNIHENQETKEDIIYTPLTLEPDASFLTCGKQLNQQGEMKHSKSEKRPKLKRILLLGYHLSFLVFLFLTVLSSDVKRERRGGTSPPQCPCEGERQRALTQGTPGLSQHQLHICSLVVDT